MQSQTSGNRFMTTSEDNIPNGFCQTANVQCAMPMKRGLWICSHLCPAHIPTTEPNGCTLEIRSRGLAFYSQHLVAPRNEIRGKL